MRRLTTCWIYFTGRKICQLVFSSKGASRESRTEHTLPNPWLRNYEEVALEVGSGLVDPTNAESAAAQQRPESWHSSVAALRPETKTIPNQSSRIRFFLPDLAQIFWNVCKLPTVQHVLELDLQQMLSVEFRSRIEQPGN